MPSFVFFSQIFSWKGRGTARVLGRLSPIPEEPELEAAAEAETLSERAEADLAQATEVDHSSKAQTTTVAAAKTSRSESRASSSASGDGPHADTMNDVLSKYMMLKKKLGQPDDGLLDSALTNIADLKMEIAKKQYRYEQEKLKREEKEKEAKEFRLEYLNYKLSCAMDNGEISRLEHELAIPWEWEQELTELAETIATFKVLIKEYKQTNKRILRDNDYLKTILGTEGFKQRLDELDELEKTNISSPRPLSSSVVEQSLPGSSRDRKTPKLPKILRSNKVADSSMMSKTTKAEYKTWLGSKKSVKSSRNTVRPINSATGMPRPSSRKCTRTPGTSKSCDTEAVKLPTIDQNQKVVKPESDDGGSGSPVSARKKKNVWHWMKKRLFSL